MRPKVYEILKLNDNNIHMLGVAETFIKSDGTIDIDGYRWILNGVGSVKLAQIVMYVH